MGRRIEEYAVYKGENILCLGTAKDCAKELKVTSKYIQWMTNPAYGRRLAKRKYPERCTVAIRI